jgi:tRNA 2-thiouridine synthesizing protein A
MNQIDARGYSCPEPVLMTKQALKKYGVPLQVLVDSQTPLENVTRLATNAGHQVTHRMVDGDYEITIS